MPTYDYECPKGHRFEVVQRMTDKPVASCPRCKARARRQISGGAGFLFKGEGFYITDYRSEDYKKKASAEAGASSEKAEKSETAAKSDAPSKSKSEGAKSEGSKPESSKSEGSKAKGSRPKATKTSSDS
ncbi:MAG: zinc ribbon domain-containing protein [Gemmatimonadetes bacterium]|nr:zinc ribbon domain-containing protein [Gemmatimonadota bacterium]